MNIKWNSFLTFLFIYQINYTMEPKITSRHRLRNFPEIHKDEDELAKNELKRWAERLRIRALSTFRHFFLKKQEPKKS